MPQTYFRHAKACQNASTHRKGAGTYHHVRRDLQDRTCYRPLGIRLSCFQTCKTLALELSWCKSSAFGILADFAPKLHAVKSEVLSARRA
eukprot:IDg22460t1